MIGVGEKFPEFKLTGVSGNQCNLNEDWHDADHDFITIKSWNLKDWSVIYFYPKDFTFICPTEIVGMDSLMSETDEVFGISPDNEYCKWNWKTGDEHAQAPRAQARTEVIHADALVRSRGAATPSGDKRHEAVPHPTRKQTRDGGLAHQQGLVGGA